MAMQEIVISGTSCPEANSILVWDLLTGRVLHSFENNVSQPAGRPHGLVPALEIFVSIAMSMILVQHNHTSVKLLH